MKYTQYFLFTRSRPDRSGIRLEWIEHVIDNYEYEEIQDDARIRRWAYIEEVNKYLRVILLPDGETVHNAFFDRDYTGRHPQ